MKELIQVKKKETIERIYEMVDLLGLTDTFGAESKTIEFCITLAKEYIISMEKVIPTLPDDKMMELIKVINKHREVKIKRKELKELQKDVKSNTTD